MPTKLSTLLPPLPMQQLLALLAILVTMLDGISAEGLGEDLLWEQNYNSSPKGNQADLVFQLPIDKGDTVPPTWLDIQKSVQSELVKVSLDLVDPDSELLQLMNFVSTKSRIVFLKDYQRYYQDMQIASTNRPMLFSYLGLHFMTNEQIASWYEMFLKRSGRSRDKILDACKRVLAQLKVQHDQLPAELMAKVRDLAQDFKLPLAYEVFQSHKNLFVLENFGLLCRKIQPKDFAPSGEIYFL